MPASLLFWGIALFLSLLTLGFVLWPLWQGAKTAEIEADAGDTANMKLGLQETERDIASGLIAAEDAESMRAEAARRVLKAARTIKTPLNGKAAPVLAGLLLVLGLGATAALYFQNGTPDLLAGGQAAKVKADILAQHPQMGGMVESLEKKLAEDPKNAEGWVLLARSYQQLAEPAKAIAAFEKAMALIGRGNPIVLGDYAETLVVGNKGRITPPAEKAFREVLAIEVGNARARYYLALAQAQSGMLTGALTDLRKLDADLAPDASLKELVGKQIVAIEAAIRAEGGEVPVAVPVTEVGQNPPPAIVNSADPNPSKEQVEAVLGMEKQDQEAMIEGMVANLAAKLAENPNDLAGWMRLGRSYGVLGKTAEAKAAWEKAAALDPDNPQVKSALQAFGTEKPAAPKPAPVPAAAPQAVGNLAAVKTEGRSLLDSGKNREAFELFANALKTAPQDIDLLSGQAEAEIILSAGEKLPETAVNNLRMVLLLNPQHAMALWYVGLDAAQRQDKVLAVTLWQRLLTQIEPKSEEYDFVQKSIDLLQK